MVQPLVNVEREIENFIQTYQLQGTENCPASWTVALSGGVDSMVLLYLLRNLAPACHAHLKAVHVEHGVREAALGDAHFVQGICREWDIPVLVKAVRLGQIEPGQSRGVEADLRRLRYQAIREVASGLSPTERRPTHDNREDEGGGDTHQEDNRRENDYRADEREDNQRGDAEREAQPLPVVFLGHHANDQLETILFRLVRGTSLSGLSGIRPIREWDGIRLARPMLALPKRSLYSFAARNEIPYVEDETNHSTVYQRNYIRLKVIPELARLQPNLEQTVARAAQILQSEDEFLEKQSRELLERIAKTVPKGFRLGLDALREAPLPLQRRIIKIILYYLASADWTFDDVESILELCDHDEPSAQVHLQADVLARRVYDQLEILQGSTESRGAYCKTWNLSEEGDRALIIESDSGTWTFHGAQSHFSARERHTGPYDTWFPRDFEMVIAPVKPGTRMRPLGLNGSKKVQDLFVDRKIPRHLRRDWPCFFFRDELVWIPGVARSESFVLQEGEPGWLVSGSITGL